MEEDNAPEFKINIDGVDPDSLLIDEKKEVKRDIRIERLNRKITTISILFPCIVFILLIIIYFNVKNKIAWVHDSGTLEVKNLSKNIDKKTAEFSSLYSKLEDSFEKKLSGVDKMGLSLKSELINSVNEIKKEAKDNNAKTTNSIAQINQQFSAAQKDIIMISGKIKDVGTEVSSKISNINDKLNKIENDFAKFRTSFTAIVSEKINSKADKKDIELALINEQKRFQYESDKFERDIEQKINAIKRQLYELEQKAVKMPPYQALPLNPDNTNKPAVKASPSKPGKVIEQDL